MLSLLRTRALATVFARLTGKYPRRPRHLPVTIAPGKHDDRPLDWTVEVQHRYYLPCSIDMSGGLKEAMHRKYVLFMETQGAVGPGHPCMDSLVGWPQLIAGYAFRGCI